MEYIFPKLSNQKKNYFKVFIFLLLVVGNSYADTLLVANKQKYIPGMRLLNRCLA